MLYFSNIKSELQSYMNPRVFYNLKLHAIPVTMLHQFPGDSTGQYLTHWTLLLLALSCQSREVSLQDNSHHILIER